MPQRRADGVGEDGNGKDRSHADVEDRIGPLIRQRQDAERVLVEEAPHGGDEQGNYDGQRVDPSEVCSAPRQQAASPDPQKVRVAPIATSATSRC